MNRKFIIITDVDDTLAGLVPRWLERYNYDWDDNLTMDKITEWNMIPFVKKSCGEQIYSYLNDPNLYNGVKPIPLSLAGVNSLRSMGHRVVFCTSSTIAHQGRKAQWLMDFGYLKDMNDYIACSDKSLIRGDIIIDDRFENVQDPLKFGILFNRPWNKNKEWFTRVDNWYQIIDLVKGLSNG
jgi:5'(3')-deoxyribonucleotidase